MFKGYERYTKKRPGKTCLGAGGLKNQYSSSQTTLGSEDTMNDIFVSYLTVLRLKRGILMKITCD